MESIPDLLLPNYSCCDIWRIFGIFLHSLIVFIYLFIYLFIPHFFVKPTKVFCGTLIGQNWFRFETSVAVNFLLFISVLVQSTTKLTQRNITDS